MLLKDIRGGSNISKHNSHGKCLENSITKENRLAKESRIVTESTPKRGTGGTGEGMVGFTERQEEKKKGNAKEKENNKNTPPIGDGKKKTTQNRGKDRSKALNHAEHGKITCEAITIVKIRSNGTSNDNTTSTGNPLEETVK